MTHQLILTRISPGPGVGTSISVRGAVAVSPRPCLTAAFCLVGILGKPDFSAGGISVEAIFAQS